MPFAGKVQKAEVAQSVEQGTENPRVGSSILSLGTKLAERKEGVTVYIVTPFLLVVKGRVNKF